MRAPQGLRFYDAFKCCRFCVVKKLGVSGHRLDRAYFILDISNLVHEAGHIVPSLNGVTRKPTQCGGHVGNSRLSATAARCRARSSRTKSNSRDLAAIYRKRSAQVAGHLQGASDRKRESVVRAASCDYYKDDYRTSRLTHSFFEMPVDPETIKYQSKFVRRTGFSDHFSVKINATPITLLRMAPTGIPYIAPPAAKIR